MQQAANQRTRKFTGVISIWVFVWSLLLNAITFAQSPSTFKQDFGLWAPVFMTVKLPKSFYAYMEVNPRFFDLDDAGDIGQLLLRPAVGYQLTEKLSIWQGYAWVGNFNVPHTPSQSSFFEENRIYQQANYVHKFQSWNTLSRVRLEERWIEDAAGTAVRLRLLWRGLYPLPKAPQWAFATYDEVFINLNTVQGRRGPEAGFDQNRFFIGINRTFSKNFNMDFGYQNQLLNSKSIPDLANQMNHIILLNFFINL
ncbi:MAG: DUF2490 domain-containing protein [Nitrospira sp.]|nr:DUF2490 domain-containing protein [Nitrospira sp.]